MPVVLYAGVSSQVFAHTDVSDELVALFVKLSLEVPSQDREEKDIEKEEISASGCLGLLSLNVPALFP